MKILTKRKKSRKLLYQELFAMSMNSFDSKLFRESFFSDDFEYEFDEKYIKEMENIILKNEAFFISIIQKYSPKFDIKFMSRIIILPIYIWLAEIFFYEEEIWTKIIINEAVEIAKMYWDDSSKKIVNWVLNSVIENYKELKKLKFENYTYIKDSFFYKKIL